MRRRKKGYGGIMFLSILLAIIGGAVYLYTSDAFERDVPDIRIENSGYWNGEAPLKVSIDDQSGILEYKITLISGSNQTILSEAKMPSPEKSKQLELQVPARTIGKQTDVVTLEVEVRDASRWNFFAGNRAVQRVTLKIDAHRPKVGIIANSYKITQGGSALVVFEAEDENLEELYVETSFGRRFKAEPFYATNYYVALIAWPVTSERFRAYVIATDVAGNRAKAYIPLHLQEKQYHVSKIKLSDHFLNGKVSDLAQMYGAPANADMIERFRYVNETMRAQNEELIHNITSKVGESQVDGFEQQPFYPLRNGQVVASFGDHRLYYYNGEKVSESYHLGLDLASVKMGKIKIQNPSEIVFADENGIYGNMPILAHGLGLYTLYGHCSNVNVTQGEHVDAGTHIANTGMTGYAMGDHLHFGVLVQGVEVRPEEWMDKQWIRLNVTDVIKEAKKVIDRRR
ncbi:MAG: M23 family metallopeptidase [Campylobacterales bacterium]|nr:M23 family metallopeptidase [Campylobacterales bacterium]